MEDTVLFFHLLGVLLFTAGVAVAGVAFEAARRRERAAEIALLLGLSRIGALFVACGGVLLFACGMWLVGLEDIGFGTGWVSAAMGLFAVALLLGALAGQRPKRARKLAARMAGDGGEPDTTALRRLLDDRLSRAANYVSAALVLAILVLMVFKP